MGRKTFASLKVKPLSQRKTIVVSWNPNYEFNHPDVIVSNDLEGILKQYEHSGDELYVCGGLWFIKSQSPMPANYLFHLLMIHMEAILIFQKLISINLKKLVRNNMINLLD
nr:dihydrofolate reductase [Spiroplasma endosymbiont of 'Nebria riversi']